MLLAGRWIPLSLVFVRNLPYIGSFPTVVMAVESTVESALDSHGGWPEADRTMWEGKMRAVRWRREPSGHKMRSMGQDGNLLVPLFDASSKPAG
jgi:hypothetical protein